MGIVAVLFFPFLCFFLPFLLLRSSCSSSEDSSGSSPALCSLSTSDSRVINSCLSLYSLSSFATEDSEYRVSTNIDQNVLELGEAGKACSPGQLSLPVDNMLAYPSGSVIRASATA